jgi:hypothetical protein
MAVAALFLVAEFRTRLLHQHYQCGIPLPIRISGFTIAICCHSTDRSLLYYVDSVAVSHHGWCASWPGWYGEDRDSEGFCACEGASLLCIQLLGTDGPQIIGYDIQKSVAGWYVRLFR